MRYLDEALECVALAKEEMDRRHESYFQGDTLTETVVVERNKIRMQYLGKLLGNLTEGEMDEDAGYPEQKEFNSMWVALYKKELKLGKNPSYGWVIDFVDAVIDAYNFPQYLISNNTNKNKLLEDLRSCTEKLKDIYKNNSYNYGIVPDDGFFTDGFLAVGVGDDDEMYVLPIDEHPKISISTVLDGVYSLLSHDIRASLQGETEKEDDYVEQRIFLKQLCMRNRDRYNAPLYSSLRIATWCVYGKYYSDSTVSNILNKRS